MINFKKLLLAGMLLFISGCSKKCEFEFCFTTIVNGRVYVTETQIGEKHAPCGFLSSVNGPLSNEEYDFERLEIMDLCGSTACCYYMEPPDSAYIRWGNELDGKSYEKRIKLPSYPKRKFGERYRISFAIAYQDCVYCRIETVKK